MTYEIVKAFRVFETTNEYSAKGSCVGIFSTKSQAEQSAEGRGWYGGKGLIITVSLIRIDGKLLELASEYEVDLDGHKASADAKLKADTLANLTPDQKRVLGLK